MPLQPALSPDESAFLPLSAAATFADQVADQIVEAIAGRRLASGERLIETELAAALHVSRVPVREAIRLLTSQGIVVAAPRRGVRVATFDAPWARQLHDARVAIERLGAHLAADVVKRDASALARLRACVGAIERARGDWLAVNRADIAFHAAVFEIAGSPLMITLWNAISRHVLIMFSIETCRRVDFDRVIREHHDYIEALLHRTPEEIDREIDLHVSGLKTFEF